MSPPPEPAHPPASLFFLSYAHSRATSRNAPPRERDRHAVKFFNDLSENVSWLVSRAAGEELGFMDRTIRYGSQWSGELLHALGSCQAFVALLSEPYTTCDWCGMEWHAFSQRKVVAEPGAGDQGRQTPIFPVIWAPMPAGRTPVVIRRVQRFAPAGLPAMDLVANYERFGVLGLMQLRRWSAYRGIVWTLAQSIATFHHSHWVQPQIFQQHELRNVFGDDEP